MPPVMSGAPVGGMPLMANGGMNASTYPVPPVLQPNLMPMAPAGNMFPTSPNGMGVLDSHVWFQADYLLFWINGAQLPPLLTESRAGTPLLRAGVVGAPGTTTVFGDEGVNDNLRSGVRTRIGGWLDDARQLGVEFGFFMLEGQGQGAAVGSYDADVIAGRPFISAITDRRAVEFVSFPRVLAGVATVDASSTNFYAADALIRYNLLRGTARARIHKCPEVDGCFSMDLVGGYRFLNYGDSVRIREEVFLVSQSQLDSRLLVSDDFAARNTFHGGFLGFDTEIQRGRWSLKTLIRGSLGQGQRRVTIRGESVNENGDKVVSQQAGGLLALSSNIGTYQETGLVFIPEGDFILGYQLTDGLRLRLGYSVLYWPSVVRAGQQIDTVVNNNLLPGGRGMGGGPDRPAFSFQKSDLWVQGISAGLELAY